MKRIRQITAFGLAAAMALASVGYSYASADTPQCDETLYVTMDPYGEVKSSSVVKGYSVNGAVSIVDYGVYDKVVNMSDFSQPQIGEEGTVSFDLQSREEGENRFYFEGKFAGLPQELPWEIQVNYRLNGVEKAAEDLPGAQGLVEVNIHLIPNKNALEYFRNTMVLTAAAMVDMDKNVSVEAKGAQIQAMGNLKAVLFFALPGEEQHFQIRIGTEDFRFTGMLFMMVPATLAQLDHITDLREVKETAKDSADAMSDSLDVILSTLNDMQGGLKETSNGLRELDHSRRILQDTKGKVYADADAALAALDDLAADMRPFTGHFSQAREALAQVNQNLNEMVSTLDDLPPQLGDLRSDISVLKDDMEQLRRWINSPSDVGIAQWQGLLADMTAHLEQLEKSQETLQAVIAGMQGNRNAVSAGAGELEAYLVSADMDFTREDMDALLDDLSGMDITGADELKDILTTDYGLSKKTVKKLVPVLKDLVGEDVSAATASDGRRLSELETILQMMGPFLQPAYGTAKSVAGMAKDARQVITMLGQAIAEASEEGSTVNSILSRMDGIGDTAKEICSIGADLVSHVDTLNNTLNDYHGEAMETLEDAGRLIDTAAQGIDTLHVFFTALENQLKTVGDSLNAGTKMTLEGLAASIDKAVEGLGQTDAIQDAKDTVKDLIDDKWEEYTGGDNNLLNIDPDAPLVSFTSSKNPPPQSIQVIMRTEEIQEDDGAQAVNADETFHPEGNIFQRIWNILKKIWESVTALLK